MNSRSDRCPVRWRSFFLERYRDDVMQQPAALFHEVEDMLRKILILPILVSLGIGLAGFESCQLTPTMEEVPEAETEVKEEASSSDEMADALELAQEYEGVIIYSRQGEFQVCFDNEELAREYTRRVNQATQTLFALRDNLCVTVGTGQ